MKRIINFIKQEIYLSNTIYLFLFLSIFILMADVFNKLDVIEKQINGIETKIVEVKECQ